MDHNKTTVLSLRIQRQLLHAAAATMENAYVPYSHFKVGAAILTSDNRIITGANVENAAYASVIHAEQSAISNANSAGYRTFQAIAIIGRSENFDTIDTTAPCGMCRQLLFEFAQISGIDTKIILSTTKQDKIVVTTISQLLPGAFGPKDLEIDVRQYQQ